MTVSSAHIQALQSFGYTPQEAHFLYLVATHSGYFLARQFLAFTGAHGTVQEGRGAFAPHDPICRFWPEL